MAGGYERVNAHDDEDIDTPTSPLPRPTQPIPNSPPPSFRSRASSRERNQRVNSDLADAFDTDGDDSDDEADDRQRLVRGSSSLATGSATPNDAASSWTSQTQGTTAHTTSASAPGPTRTSGRVYGGGIQSDGVFSNLTAKPERGGEEKEELPPSYEQAAADAAPPYWETTILAPGLGGPDDVYIDGMPVGSFFSFLWNGMISMSFQLVGFLLTYLLHSTHAAKNGSRAGLGITLIHYGFYMKGDVDATPNQGGNMGTSVGGDGFTRPDDPNSHDFTPGQPAQGDNGGGASGDGDFAGADWLAYILMIVGWFVLIRAVSDYLRARRHEQLVLQSPDRGLGIPIIATGESSERVV